MSEKPQPAGDSDLRTYLDARGVDGAPTVNGYFVIETRHFPALAEVRGAGDGHPVAFVTGSEEDVSPDDITRHAPLLLAGPPFRMPPEVLAAMEAEKCDHDVQPFGDGHWGRCSKCGDDSFPITAEAAGQCPCCGSYGDHRRDCLLAAAEDKAAEHVMDAEMIGIIREITDAAGHSGVPFIDDAVRNIRVERDAARAENDRLAARLDAAATRADKAEAERDALRKRIADMEEDAMEQRERRELAGL